MTAELQRRRDLRIAVLATLAIYCVLLVPPPPTDDGPSRFGELPEGTDKVAHLLLFAAETRWLERALRHHTDPPRSLVVAVGLGLTVALSTEWLQGLVPGRHGDPFDFLADAAGVALAALVIGAHRAGRADPSSARVIP